MPNPTDQINFTAKDKAIGEIFSGQKYRVPRYQRPYTWNEDHITDFWNDIDAAIGSYFMGSLVFNFESFNEDGFVDVIDGQQRLLTITIFMSVLRDVAKELGDSGFSHRIQTTYIALEDVIKGDQTFRILPGDSTEPYFKKFIQTTESDIINSDTKTDEENRIKKNYTLLREKVWDELKQFDSTNKKIEFIGSLIKKICAIKIIQIEIKNEDDAYQIFESVNARGAELSVADLLKNLIFKKIKLKDAKRDVVKEKWRTIEENVIETNTEITRFLRYYWLANHTFVSEKKLFKEIKQTNKKDSDYEKFLDDLVIASKIYNKLIVGDPDDWKDVKNGSKIQKSLMGIKFMNVSQCYVLFMSILKNLDKIGTDPTRIFNLVERFTFNYSYVSNLPSNKFEKVYSRYARDINQAVNDLTPKNIPKRVQFLFSSLEKELKDLNPKFEQFNASFMDIAYQNTERKRVMIKYILSRINDNKSSGEYKIDFDNVNIEHLLPQKPNKEWKIDKSQIKDFVDLLGNLTLVHKKTNSRAGNKSMKDKAQILKKSEIAITKEIAKKLIDTNYKWGGEEIKKRHEELAKISYDEIWAF